MRKVNYKYLGRSGVKVSRLCLGTMNFGVDTDEKEAFRIMDAALDAGINFFDTANGYGWGVKVGLTEEIIGRWFAQGGGRRERVVLAAKVYGQMADINYGPNDAPGLSSYKIRRHLNDSLRRLQTDHIELYQMHHIDRHVPWEEVWEAFQREIQQGKLDYIGSSNFAGWHLMKAQSYAKQRNMLGIVSEQHNYSLLNRIPELEVIPAAQDLGIGIIVWGPLAGGLLGGNALNQAAGPRTKQKAALIEKYQPQLEDFSKLCKEIGESESTVSLAWLLNNSAVTAPIVGPRTLEQFNSTLKAVEFKMDEELLKKLDEIFPGPGGPAPEAYAW
jgi:aryl-alcohol dehydrogenase-like predicted oxidoreductase